MNPGVLIKFTDGESMRFNFSNLSAAMEFYHRAKCRNDTFSVTFLDPDLQSTQKSGYPESGCKNEHSPEETENA